MMYKLRFQKCGPYSWGEVHVVVGNISAIHSLYNTLLATARNAGPAWERRLVAAESLALAKELAAEAKTSPRARLWLSLFSHSASRAILEVYEDELIERTDHGDRAGDPVGHP